MKYSNLLEHYTTPTNKPDQFEHEVTLLKYMKVVSDLQTECRQTAE